MDITCSSSRHCQRHKISVVFPRKIYDFFSLILQNLKPFLCILKSLFKGHVSIYQTSVWRCRLSENKAIISCLDFLHKMKWPFRWLKIWWAISHRLYLRCSCGASFSFITAVSLKTSSVISIASWQADLRGTLGHLLLNLILVQLTNSPVVHLSLSWHTIPPWQWEWCIRAREGNLRGAFQRDRCTPFLLALGPWLHHYALSAVRSVCRGEISLIMLPNSMWVKQGNPLLMMIQFPSSFCGRQRRVEENTLCRLKTECCCWHTDFSDKLRKWR